MNTQLSLSKILVLLCLGGISYNTLANSTGCMDSAACNYDALATTDDGSCCYSNCVVLEMSDNAGNTWSDGYYVIYDALENEVATGSMTVEGPLQKANFCLDNGCYSLHVVAGSWPEEISWELSGSAQGIISGDGSSAEVTHFSVGNTDCLGCTNAAACNYSPTALMDNGQCIEGPCVNGDNPWNALPLQINSLGTCTAVSKSLAPATASSIAGSSAITGEDLWFSIVPQTKGIRIQVTSSSNNIMIELLDQNYNLVDSENLIDIKGGEALNFGSLTVGSTYFIGVRNYDSSQGIGSFSICAQALKSTKWVTSAPYASLCDLLKTTYCGDGVTYRFQFTPSNNPAQTFTKVQSSNLLPLYNISELSYNTTYSLVTSAVYHLPNSLGVSESITVAPVAVDQVGIGPQPLTELIVKDQCESGPKNQYSWIKAIYTCGATDYKWSFEELIDGNPAGLPFVRYRGAASNQINLNSIAQLQPGKTYRVKVAPVFGGLGGPGGNGNDGIYGSYQNLCIVGSAMILQENENVETHGNLSERSLKMKTTATIYPNPNKGDQVTINFTPGDNSGVVDLYLFDAVGRKVFNKHYAFEGSLNTVVDLHEINNTGFYLMEFVTANEKMTQRLIIE